ncbi:glycosyltransferase family 2 protein [Poseidonocella sedimentorum]|uniref:Glycosyltransferase, catalytic subunit of cellulose synthase and poly-beta-1,6-N-acetylglucosamine synthase n=1 Tax=Poseidonocella sedimentorum TaxID=871652 RepID=A0A1I6DDR2_9RHOB|nr:glycosyltransferase family 2 protein [Poseidonocella sedimentorum]SFR03501.1 Glycosyltransferase, catalytic subunit of cellulose synthase and poly-beta-1,6-N-acetylglucosamine synthase [Poseidonocella sedimentorum]
MSDASLRLETAEPLVSDRAHVRLGEILVSQGLISNGELTRAIKVQKSDNAKLGDVLVALGLITEAELYRALSLQKSAQYVDLAGGAPMPRLIERVDPSVMQKVGFVPWSRVGGLTVIATAYPERLEAILEALPDDLKPAILAVTPVTTLEEVLRRFCGETLARRAETRVPEEVSCRTMQDNSRFAGLFAAITVGALIAALVYQPVITFTALASVASVSLLFSTLLKIAAFTAALTSRRRESFPKGPPGWKRPTISILVPLHREQSVAEVLVKRLDRLDYPRHLLDILLVVEEGDSLTRDALAKSQLPVWYRTIVVPPGHPQTKPRALNYALDFCRGEIVGIYDAEDAPAPDQLEKVARRFRDAPWDVVCLQGVLDYYNARHNWMARCFAIEYATWFRVFLPGIARLGFPIPLGGTTLFFQRKILERFGGWDAHNVTEDADLGIRLARHGYRTELIDTVTMEEANCRAWPWVRQRSRWLKGYMATYAVHMRRPWTLFRQLGAWRFFGFQIFFLTSIVGFLFAPVLWSFWLVLLGAPHPLTPVLSTEGTLLIGAGFLAMELVGVAVSSFAVRGERHRHLMKWTPGMMLYFPLATLAAYKGLYELIARPFFWDKTEHGHSQPGPE